MNILRRLGLSLAILLFSVSISATALLISLHFVIDTPQPLEKSLQSSGIYDSFVQDTLAKQATTSASLPFTDPGVQKAFEQALPPSFVQNASEQAIGSIYSWVQGVTPSLTFSIDTSAVRTNFADNLAAYVQQKVAALPPCTQFTLPSETVDGVLSMTCLPRGISVSSIADAARTEALNSELFPKNNTIDASFLKNAQGQPVTNQIAFVPQLHSYYELSLWVLPVLALLSGAAIVYWSVTRRAGLKRVAWLLITTGLTSTVVAALGVWFLQYGVTVFGPTIFMTQDKLLAIVETLAIDLRLWWVGFGVGYVTLGIILLVIIKLNPVKPSLTMGSGDRGYEPLSSIGNYNDEITKPTPAEKPPTRRL